MGFQLKQDILLALKIVYYEPGYGKEGWYKTGLRDCNVQSNRVNVRVQP
jgi:hypothetical protein